MWRPYAATCSSVRNSTGMQSQRAAACRGHAAGLACIFVPFLLTTRVAPRQLAVSELQALFSARELPGPDQVEARLGFVVDRRLVADPLEEVIRVLDELT